MGWGVGGGEQVVMPAEVRYSATPSSPWHVHPASVLMEPSQHTILPARQPQSPLWAEQQLSCATCGPFVFARQAGGGVIAFKDAAADGGVFPALESAAADTEKKAGTKARTAKRARIRMVVFLGDRTG